MNEHVLPSEALERPVKITQEYVLVHLSEKELLNTSFDKKTIKLVVILYKRERERRESGREIERI